MINTNLAAAAFELFSYRNFALAPPLPHLSASTSTFQQMQPRDTENVPNHDQSNSRSEHIVIIILVITKVLKIWNDFPWNITSTARLIVTYRHVFEYFSNVNQCWMISNRSTVESGLVRFQNFILNAHTRTRSEVMQTRPVAYKRGIHVWNVSHHHPIHSVCRTSRFGNPIEDSEKSQQKCSRRSGHDGDET